MQYAILVAFLLLLTMLAATATYGRRAARTISFNSLVVSTERHKTLAKWFVVPITAVAIATVLAAEPFFRSRGGPPPVLFKIHLWMGGIPFVAVLLLLVFKYTGEKYPLAHAKLAYTCLTFFLVTLVTGIELLFPGFWTTCWEAIPSRIPN